jgi:hypothetical protein
VAYPPRNEEVTVARAWTDDEVKIAAKGIITITRDNRAGFDGMNQDEKSLAAKAVGRTVDGIKYKMRQIAYVLAERKLGANRRAGDKPGPRSRAQIERVLDTM